MKLNLLSCQHFPLRKFLNPIVRVLIQECWLTGSDSKSTYPASVLGKPSILFTLALPRVGFLIWASPSGLPGRQLRLTLSSVKAKSSKLKPYLGKLNTVSKNRLKDRCLVTVAASLFSPFFECNLPLHIYNFKIHILEEDLNEPTIKLNLHTNEHITEHITMHVHMHMDIG